MVHAKLAVFHFRAFLRDEVAGEHADVKPVASASQPPRIPRPRPAEPIHLTQDSPPQNPLNGAVR